MNSYVTWCLHRKRSFIWAVSNQEACKQLLIKCYLVVGEYQKAEQLATDLINNHGLALMNAPFGTNVSSGNPETWPVERVMDLGFASWSKYN